MNKINFRVGRASCISAILLVVANFTLMGCSAGRDKTNIEVFQGMMEQRNLKSQDYDEFQNHASNRVPPPGTVPRGYTPYKYAGYPLDAEAHLVNPLNGEKFQASLARGQDRFMVYCSMCHGKGAQGDGPVAQYMPLRPPSLLTDKIRTFKDGRIFHIITDGQGLMGSYASQINKEEDRWAIVNYIRSLQK